MRPILMILALLILVAIGLFYTGVLSWPGGNAPVQVNPVEVKTETRQINVQVPVVSTPAQQPPPANGQ